MSKKVLITGATGFVGYHLIESALKAGLEVYAAVRTNSNKMHLSDLQIKYTELNYSSIEELKKQLEDNQYNYIIHAAGTTKAKNKVTYDNVNAENTRNLAIAASLANIQLEKFIFVSSLAALGPLTDLSAQIQDDTAARPVTKYGASKLLAEQSLFEIPDFPLLIIRPTAVYGPWEKDIFILFKSINRGLEPYIGRFKQQLSFVYVTDLANVIVNSLFSSAAGKAYNISDGNMYDRYALGKYIKKTLDKRTFKFHLPVPFVAAMAAFMDWIYANRRNTPTLNKEKMAELTAVNWACNIENAKRDLGYNPDFDLEKGISSTVKWYKDNHWL